MNIYIKKSDFIGAEDIFNETVFPIIKVDSVTIAKVKHF